MKTLLLSTYDLGHQPFALSSLTAWLRADGNQVACNDVAVDPLDEAAVAEAGVIGIHLAMHTATRLALELLPRIRELNPTAHLCFFGLYAPLNVERLQTFGPCSIFGGESEPAVREAVRSLGNGRLPAPIAPIQLDKIDHQVPDRSGLPTLERYAFLTRESGERAMVGYTEASRGCKHLCRHCPVVPVYDGRFRIVPAEIVLADAEQQIAAGATHISFGDPDFFNGPGHGLRIVRALHDAHPDVTYDVTIKVEHLLEHAGRLAELRETGCLYITTAVESVEDEVLGYLDKGHTRADFITAARLAREEGLLLSPTFVPFTPWTTIAGYRDLLRVIAELDLIDQVAPVQLAIRLLLPEGSKLLELDEIQPSLGTFDADALSYTWRNPDPDVDALQQSIETTVATMENSGAARRQVFAALWRMAGLHEAALPAPASASRVVPVMSENWYCCAEPTSDQLARI